MMLKNIPFFYSPVLTGNDKVLTLDESTSKHVVQVLRMKTGDQIRLTDGKGLSAVAELLNPHKKSAEVTILSTSIHRNSNHRSISIAISPVKNSSRFEWFLEKATELGVTEIYPLLCSRTERAHFRYDRMNAICISAMLQSQQTWLPILHQPTSFKEFVSGQNKENGSGDFKTDRRKWIAHCTESEKTPLSTLINNELKNGLILIGPEGDFTNEEIETALANGFTPVALGDTRLRTETAGVVAATLLMLC